MRRGIGAVRVERHPHLAAEDLRVDVAEAEKRAGIVGLDEHHLASVGAASAQVPGQRRIAPELAVHRQAADRAAAPRHLQIEAAQGLAVEADDRAELEVEIDIPVVLALRLLAPPPLIVDLMKSRPS